MTRSQTCHDNPLYLPDNNEVSVRDETDAVIHSPDLENNQSTEDLSCYPENQRSNIAESKKCFLVTEAIGNNIYKENKKHEHCSDDSFEGTENDGMGKARCIDCSLSKYSNHLSHNKCNR